MKNRYLIKAIKLVNKSKGKMKKNTEKVREFCLDRSVAILVYVAGVTYSVT